MSASHLGIATAASGLLLTVASHAPEQYANLWEPCSILLEKLVSHEVCSIYLHAKYMVSVGMQPRILVLYDLLSMATGDNTENIAGVACSNRERNDAEYNGHSGENYHAT